jgi:hypothetical protein
MISYNNFFSTINYPYFLTNDNQKAFVFVEPIITA